MPQQEPSTLPPGISAEEIRAHQERQSLYARAHAEPLPGPLADAFASTPVTIAGLTIRPLVHYDYVLLKRLNSPLYRQMLRAGTGQSDQPETPYTDEEGYEMIYQFTRSIRRVIADLEKGRDFFRALCIDQIGAALTLPQITALVEACVVNFIRSASTAVAFDGSKAGQPDGFFFSPTGPTTDSAPGSSTSVG